MEDDVERAEQALAAGDPTAALHAGQAALAENPNDPRAHMVMGRLMRAAGEIDIAFDHMQAANRGAPDSAAFALEFAELLTAQGRFGEAGRSIARAVASAPNAGAPAVAALDLFMRIGDPGEAATVADGVLARFPNHVGAIRTAALARSAVGRHAEAAGLLENALAGSDLAAPLRAALLFALVRIRVRAGEHDEAWAAAEAANAARGLRLDHEAHRLRVERIMTAFDGAAETAFAPGSGSGSRVPPGPPGPPGPVRPIFIVGMPRSGTTLVEQILASHPEVAGAGELGLLERSENRLGAAVMFPESFATCGDTELTALTRFGNEGLAAKAGGRPVVTEKSVSNALYLGIVPRLFPTARIVFCDRDPLDTCVSCYFIDFDAHLPYAYDLTDLGVYHRAHDRLVAHWRDALPLPSTTVRYEDLVADQERVTRELLKFCGLPFDERCLAFHENERFVTTASAEQVRKPMYTTSVGRHRHYARHLGPLRDALVLDGAAAV